MVFRFYVLIYKVNDARDIPIAVPKIIYVCISDY